MSLLEQVRTFAALVDIQGKGYSARLKLLLHSGRPVLLCARPWVEFFHPLLKPWVHYVPVRADLADLVAAAEWVAANPAEAAAIGARAQALAREHLTYSAALAEIRRTLMGMVRAGCVSPGGNSWVDA